MNIKQIQNPLIKNTLKLTAGSTISYIIPILATPILSRLFSPSDFGVWGIFSAYVTILAIVTCGGYEFAIVRSKKIEDVINISALCFIVNICFNIALTTIIILSEVFGWAYVNNIPFKWFIPIYLFITGLIAIFNNYANRMERYSILAFAQIVNGSFQVIGRISFGILKSSLNGLILGTVVSIIATFSYLSVKSKDILTKIKFISFSEIKRLAIENKKFPLFDAPSTLLIYASNNIPILILSHHFQKDSVGFYTMVLQLLLMPMAFIGSNMGSVFYRQLTGNENETTIIAKQVFKISLLLGFSSILFFLLGGDTILALLLGTKWITAGTFALFLSIWAFPAISFAPLRPIYRAKNKQNIQILITGTSFIIQTMSLIWAINNIDKIDNVILIYAIVCALFKGLEGFIIFRLCGINLKGINLKYYLFVIFVILFWIVRISYKLYF